MIPDGYVVGRLARRPTFFCLIAAGLSIVGTTGCATHVIRTGALDATKKRYAYLRDNGIIGRAWAAEWALLSDYRVLCFEGVRAVGQAEEASKHCDRYCTFLVQHVVKGLRAKHRLTDGRIAHRFDVVTTDPSYAEIAAGDRKAAKMVLFISHLNESNGILRYVIGFGAGSVDVQVEGRVVDAETGERLMEFADRRRQSGDPYSGLNPTVVMAAPLVEKVLEQQAAAIVKVLVRQP